MQSEEAYFSVSPAYGVTFSPFSKSGRQPVGLSMRAVHHSCVFPGFLLSLPLDQLYGALVPEEAAPAAEALFIV